MMSKALSVPRLRFPEFKDAGDWEEKQLGKVATFHSGGTPSKSNPEYWEGSIPWISALSMHETTIGDSNTHVTEKAVKDGAQIAPKGTLLLLVRGSMLHKRIPLGITTTEVTYNQDVKSLSLEEGVTVEFLMYLLMAAEWELLNIVTKTGIGAGKLDSADLNSFLIRIPSPPEQKKIVDCLIPLNIILTSQSQKLDALKTHKKSLMQQLFPCEGEVIPRLRFPEFRDAGDWDEKQLGKLSEIVRGGSPRPIDDFLTIDQTGLNWLKIGDVDRDSKYVTHTQEKVRIEALGKTREVYPGDLILSNSMSFGRPYILDIKSCIHDGWIAITQLHSRVDRDYLYYQIRSPRSQAFFVNNAAGSGVQNLNADIIKSLLVSLPPANEQQKIAECLTSIDDLITAEAQKLNALKTHKKGLMQQLFPTSDEVKV